MVAHRISTTPPETMDELVRSLLTSRNNARTTVIMTPFSGIYREHLDPTVRSAMSTAYAGILAIENDLQNADPDVEIRDRAIFAQTDMHFASRPHARYPMLTNIITNGVTRRRR